MTDDPQSMQPEGQIDVTRATVTLAAASAPSDTILADTDELDLRKLRILSAIVTEFVAKGEPVGSKSVVDVAQLDVSAATVRNEMAELEERGYITQPHTSAGRIPTDRGYRRFVDELKANTTVDGPQRELVEELLGSAKDVEDLLARTSSVLSQLTRLVSLVIAPAFDATQLRLIELVPLHGQLVLLLIVSDAGQVEKRVVELPEGTTQAERERVRRQLSETLIGRNLATLPGVIAGMVDDAPSDLRGALSAIAKATQDGISGDATHHVFVGGQASLAGDETFGREHLSSVLQLLEERATLAKLLNDVTVDDTTGVMIGGENTVEDLRAASLVAQRYELLSAGALGVLGPTRMDYGRALSTVRIVSEQLQATLRTLSTR
ncbi:MAG: heat-inducible transcriptional repressor HrcA [Nitriliruptoraceae bacterium]